MDLAARRFRVLIGTLLVMLCAVSMAAQGTLAITTSSLPDATQNVAYNFNLAASGGFTPYNWSIISGNLPAGLSLTALTGKIHGTPTGTGTSNFTMKVTDSHGGTATKALSITVYAQLIVTTGTLPTGIQNTPYSATLSASGGDGTYTWFLVSGSLPAGLSLSSAGVISGTPTGTGTSNFYVKVADGHSHSGSGALSITIYPPLTITTSSLPAGTQNTTYSAALTANGGDGSYTWSLDAGTLPSGLSLSSAGVISGTPTGAGTSNFTAQVTDGHSNIATQALSITIDAPLTITTSSLPAGTQNVTYSATLTATGGSGSYSWSLLSGSLPAGITLTSGGVISGTPTATGTSNFTIRVTDTLSNTATQALNITINAANATSSILLWSNPNPSLPNSPVAISSQVYSSGGPTPTGSVIFQDGTTVLGSESLAPVSNTNFILYSSQFDSPAWTTDGGNSLLTPNYATSPLGDQTAYRYQDIDPSSPAYIYQVVTGLPSTQPITFSLWLKSNTGSTQDLHLDIYDIDNGIDKDVPYFVTPTWQRVSIATANPTTSVTVRVGSDQEDGQRDISIWGGQVESSNSVGPYVSTTAGAATATVGLATLTAGSLSSGSHSITANYSGDGNYPPSTSTSLTQSVQEQLVITTFNPLVNAFVGTPYSTTLHAVGGTPPYTWTMIGGNLPSGLSLGADGLISGTPEDNGGGPNGRSTFAVQLTDSSSPANIANREFDLDFVYELCPMRRVDPKLDCSEGGAFIYALYPNQASAGASGQSVTAFGCFSVDINGNMGTLTFNLPSGLTEIGNPVITGIYQATVAGAVNIASNTPLTNQISVHQTLDNCDWDSNSLPYYVVPNFVDPGPCDECEQMAGQPINLTTGDIWISKTDYSVPGLAGGLSLTRTWNSLWSQNQPPFLAGMFGAGWTSSFEERLQSFSQTQIEYWRAAGNRWVFQQPADCPTCSYIVATPPNQHATLDYDSLTGIYTIAFADGTTRLFNSNGYLTRLADRNGNLTTITYDISSRITSVVAAGGQSLNFTYGLTLDPNRVTSVQDSVGNVATYSYSNSELTQAAYPDGSQQNYAYDANENITTVTDSQGKVLETHSYDGSGHGLTSAKANGVDAIAVQYSTASTILTDSMNNSTTYAYGTIGGSNFLASIQGPGCHSCGGRNNQAFNVDAIGNRVSTTDPNGNTTYHTYDSMGNILTRTDAIGTWTYTYNGFGEVLTAKDPLGNTTTNVYDGNGNLTSTTPPPPGAATQFAHNSVGELTQTIDPLHNPTNLTYYPSGLVKTFQDAQGNTTTLGYDARGNRISSKDALNNTTSFTYDSMNRLTKITHPDTTTDQFGYDIRGRRTSVTDGNGKTAYYAYDDADRLLQVTDPAGNSTTYGYDTENNLTSITDALSRTTGFQYDNLGRLQETIFPSTLTESYGYDNNGNLITKADRNGHTITYEYDAANRLTQKNYSGYSATYGYDNDNRLTAVTDPSGTYQFTYDAMGRLTGTTTNYTFLASHVFTASYGYDAASNRISFQDPEGGQTIYSYDSLNRLVQLQDPQSQVFTYSYDALSRRTRLARPNGVNTNYAYDALSRLLSVLHQTGSTTIDGATYTVDNAGNRTAKTNQPAGPTSNYAYDQIYELTGATQGANTTESYTYDAVGNRLSDLTTSGWSNNTSNELSSRPGVSYTYDNNGNELTKVDSTGTTSYTWDLENRLTGVTLPGSGGTVSFSYDPFGRRIKKSSSAGTSIYAFDGINLVEEADASGGVVARYSQGLDIDDPLAMLRGGVTSYYNADGIGSVTSLSDAAGAVVQTYTYDSFGKLTASSGSLTNPFQYTAREVDSETTLYFHRARYYDANVGRFISEDPIGFAGGINKYAYVGNSPINFTDPEGLWPITNPLNVWTWSPEAEAAFQAYVAEIEAGGIAVGSGLFSGIGGVALVVLTPTQTAGPDVDEIHYPKPQTAGKGCKGGNDGDPCKGLRDILAEHQRRLQQYASNPYANDHKGWLNRGHDESVIAGRVRGLVHDILLYQKQLEECERLHGLQ